MKAVLLHGADAAEPPEDLPPELDKRIKAWPSSRSLRCGCATMGVSTCA